jgi:hypothetical protein
MCAPAASAIQLCPLPPSTLDHRRRRVPLFREFVLPFSRDPDRRARLAAAANFRAGPPTRQEVLRTLGYGLMALPLFALCAYAPVWLSSGLRLPLWIMLLIAIPVGMVIPLTFHFAIRRIAADRIASAYAAAGYCASCGFNLNATPAEPDGCRLCPECAAAWRTSG